MSEEQVGFDVKRELSVPIQSGGIKRCVVRYPTDAELCKRVRDQRTVVHDLGRGKTKMETPNEDAVDFALFRQIRVDKDGPEFDEAEACAVIKKIERCDVIESERVGEQFRITLKVPKAETAHVVRVPLQSEKKEYGRGAMTRTGGRRADEIRMSLEPAGVLYDKVAISAEGYINGVPINHKVAVISELLLQLATEEDESPEF